MIPANLTPSRVVATYRETATPPNPPSDVHRTSSGESIGTKYNRCMPAIAINGQLNAQKSGFGVIVARVYYSPPSVPPFSFLDGNSERRPQCLKWIIVE